MNTKRFWLSCLAVYVVGQVLGFLIHRIWLGPTYLSLADLWRPEAEMQSKMWIMFVTAAVWTVGFCWIFVKGYENKGIAEGLRFGLVIGLFYSLPMAYDSYVIYPIPYSLALKWFLSGLVYTVICGLVVAAIYRPRVAA
jgi:hypothetical protein